MSIDGVGPLRYGGPVDAAAVESAGYRLLSRDECPVEVASVFSSPGHPTVGVRVDGLGSTEVAGLAVGFDAAGSTAPVDQSPRTAEGIGIGSTEAELLAAYPDATLAEFMEPPVYFVGTGIVEGGGPGDAESGSDRYMKFEVVDGRVSGILVDAGTQFHYDLCGD